MNGLDKALNEQTGHRAPKIVTATVTLTDEEYDFLVDLPAGAIVITLPGVAADKVVNRKYRGVVRSTAGGSATLVSAGDSIVAFTSASASTVGAVLSAENIIGKVWE